MTGTWINPPTGAEGFVEVCFPGVGRAVGLGCFAGDGVALSVSGSQRSQAANHPRCSSNPKMRPAGVGNHHGEAERTRDGASSNACRDALGLREARSRLDVLKKSEEVGQRSYDISLARFENGDINAQDLALGHNVDIQMPPSVLSRES